MLLKSVQDPDIVLKRFQSTLSEGSATVSTNGKDRNTETSKQNGAESIQQNIREGTESTAKAEDIVKTKAELKTLRDLLKDTQALLEAKEHMVLQAKQEVLTYLAEVENVRGRTKRDTESVKHHAVETFATELLDVVDNLSRIAETIPESFLTDSLANDTSGNAKLLKSLHDGITMTHKQLMKVASVNCSYPYSCFTWRGRCLRKVNAISSWAKNFRRLKGLTSRITWPKINLTELRVAI
ncbi:hypothetical protein KP509_04G070900 [Ceratopteris richardii]|uniref:Uncharacterized protein n=1 Tax=Ceratopteris richardii TaxID=49495 RepID=A0A8T2V1K7_CERRI|nr:hypothetical protein KP509_04G070900 [Ceratopteris richardii]